MNGDPDTNGTHVGAHLTFTDCQYTVDTTLDGKPISALDKLRGKPAKKRYLLRGITGEVTHGSVLAVMGPSGAGKTTLLNMLTLEKKGGVPRGKIELNGQPFTRALYNKNCAYVQQEDSLWASFSSRDHLRYAFDLCQPHLSASEKTAAIDKLIDAVGLTEAQHTKAGNAFVRGLSSGLKRRLSIAVALAKNPHVLFLDEPTSGIDSASAASMMTFLKEIATTEKLAIACTIHQPSASVFAGFDKTLILSDGRVAFSGFASDLGPYLASLGRPLPLAANPAEFVLDLVNKDFTDKAAVYRILDKYDEAREKLPPAAGYTLAPLGQGRPPAGPLAQAAILTRRQLQLVARDPMLYTGRMFMIVVATVFFSLVYLETRERVQTQALQRFFYTNFVVGVSCNLAISVVFAGNIEFGAIKREVKDGQYSPVAQFLAGQLINVPAMACLGLAALIPLYLIGDMPWASFGLVLLSMSANLWAFEGMGQLFSLMPNVLLGMMNFMSIWFASFLFSGLFIRIPEVIWPFRLFCYILPLGFTSQAFMWGLMKDVPEYDGAELCTEPLRAERDPLTGQPSHPCGITQDIEFWCPDEAPISCFGRTGPQILDSVGVNYSAFSSDDLYARNTGIVIAIGAVFRLLYLAWMVAKCRTSEEPKPLTPEHIAAAKPDKAPPASDDVALDPAALTPAALPPAGKWEFSFRQCSYVLNVSKSGKKSMLPFKNTVAKPLIFDVTASVSSGELLAILGPSGAGKTVLLNMLTLEAGAGTPFGHITLNGQQLTWPMYRKYCAYVPREDTLWATLTARQHLEHAFSLYRPELPAGPKRAAAVDELLDATGLTSAQHTRAGNALFKGLSGGQKRRLALAIVLVKEPKVLILDEPTSGLDSAAAAAIMRFLRELAVSKSLCVIATIHQPSAAVYSHFSKTLILAKGRTAYYGPADRMTHYFDRIGHTAQESANPAEFVLDLVCPPADHQLVVDKVLDLWADAPAHTVSPISSVEPPRDKVRTAGFGTQLRVLLKRNLMLLVRDPMLYSARIVVLALIVSFFGVIYVEQRNQIQANVMTRFFFIFWGTVVPAMFGAISVYAGNIEYLSVKGEIRNGMNSPVAYLLSNLMVQLPMMLVMAFFVCVPFWAIGNFPWEGFVHAFLLYAANMWVWESMGQFFALGSNPIMGMLNYANIWFAATLFCGLVFRGVDVIWPIRTLYYILPFKYLFGGVAWAIFKDATYAGAEECPADRDCGGRDFYCPDDATGGLQCWGRTGVEVLRSGSVLYEVVSPTNFYFFYLAMLLCQAFVYKLLQFVLLYTKSMANQRAKPLQVLGSPAKQHPGAV